MWAGVKAISPILLRVGEWCFSILQGVFFTPILQGNSFFVSKYPSPKIGRIPHLAN